MKEYKRFKTAMHRRGINLRCAGLVRQQMVEDTLVQKFILIEIVARVAKKILFGRMRNLQTSDEYDYKTLISEYFNLLFDNTTETKKYWCVIIKNSLLKRFSNALFPYERDRNYDLRLSISMPALFLRLQNLCSFEFDNNIIDDIYEYEEFDQEDIDSYDDFDESSGLFCEDHIIKINAAERSIHHIDFAEGTILSRRAACAEDGAEELFALADERFQATIDRKPDDFRALHNWALSLLHRANKKQGEEANKLYSLAYQKIASSLILNKDDEVAYLIWGNILSEQALRCKINEQASKLFKQATEKFEKSYSIHIKIKSKQSFELFYNWGNTLLHLSKYTENVKECETFLKDACEHYKQATSIEPSNKAFRNWGVVLSKLARLSNSPKIAEKLFREAEENFSRSLDKSNSDSEVYFNWGNVHYHRARCHAEKDECKLAFQQLVEAGKKYALSIENGGGYDSLTNWGKVLNLQVNLHQSHHPSDYSLLYDVNLYLAIFKNMINCDEDEYHSLSIKPVLGLAKARNHEISSIAFDCLIQLTESHIPSIKEEASRALRIAQRKYRKDLSPQSISTSNRQDGGQLSPSTSPNFHLQQQLLDTQHPSVSLFLQKLESTRTTSITNENSVKHTPPLSDFQRLSDVGSSDTCCTVFRKGTPELYVLKIRYCENSPRSSNTTPLQQNLLLDSPTQITNNNNNNNNLNNIKLSSDKNLSSSATLSKQTSATFSPTSPTHLNHTPQQNDFVHDRMMRIIQGQMPFLARILYSYRKDCNYYIIEEYISEDRSLSKLRQNGRFNNKKEELFRRNSFNFNRALPESSVCISSKRSSTSTSLLTSKKRTPSKKNTVKSDDRVKSSSKPPKPKKKLNYSDDSSSLSLSRCKSDLPDLLNTATGTVGPKYARETLPEPIAKFYIAEIILVFGYLHSLGFIYGFVLISFCFSYFF